MVNALTAEQHRAILRHLVDLGRQAKMGFPSHEAGSAYTSLMVCFLLHTISTADSLLRLHDLYGDEWYPATLAYVADRSLFEVDVNAHYISLDRANRADAYIQFGHVIRRRQLDGYRVNRTTASPQWLEYIEFAFREHWSAAEDKIDLEFERVRPSFTHGVNERRRPEAWSWSGKTLRQMAKEVDHLEAYEIYYRELCSFAHVDVALADRFLRTDSAGPVWSMRAGEFDAGNVFRFAALFMACFLGLFADEFHIWSRADVQACLEQRGV